MTTFSSSITVLGLLLDMMGAVLVLAPDWDLVNRTSLYGGQVLTGSRLGAILPFSLLVKRYSLNKSLEQLKRNESIWRDDPYFQDFHKFVVEYADRFAVGNADHVRLFDSAHNSENHVDRDGNSLVSFTEENEDQITNYDAGDIQFVLLRTEMEREITSISMKIGGTLLLIGFSLQAIPHALFLLAQSTILG